MVPPGRIPPNADIALTFEPTPDGRHPKRGGVQLHYRARPHKRTKENKKPLVAKRGPAAAIFGGAFGAMTEALDAVDAIWQALPKDKRKKNADYNQKLVDIAENLDAIEWTDALVNILENELEDRAIAFVNKKATKPFIDGPAAKYWRSPQGPTAGLKRLFQPVRVQH